MVGRPDSNPAPNMVEHFEPVDGVQDHDIEEVDPMFLPGFDTLMTKAMRRGRELGLDHGALEIAVHVQQNPAGLKWTATRVV